MRNKTLVFEGVGWAGADISINSGVGNCRIRTRIRNNEGRLIYLELGGSEFSGKYIPTYAQGLKFASHIDHCFYCDSEWDSRRSYSTELNPLLHEHFEYNKENILEFVNKKLNCSFDSIEIDNDVLNVHNTQEPLCDCSRKGYTPYKDVKYNIYELDGIRPILDYRDRGLAKYKISYDLVKSIPSLANYIANQSTERNKQQFPNYNYYAVLHWDNNGVINSLEISARENFCSMGMGQESLRTILDDIKRVGKREEVAAC